MAIEVGGILVVILLVLWRVCRCPHHWELVDKTELKPPSEDMAPGQEYTTLDTKWIFTRTVIIVIRCDKCGGSKVLREKNT